MGSRPTWQGGRRTQEGVISMSAIGEQAALLQHEWHTDPRWAGIRRDYGAQDVIRLRGRVAGGHRLARRGASRLWGLLHSQDAVGALDAVTGNHAVRQPGAGLQAIYRPGGHAADGNLAGHTDPGLAPVVAGAEAGAAPGAFELMKAVIEAGRARPECASTTSCRRTSGARIAAGRSLSRPGSTSRRSTRPGSPPTCSTSLRW